MIQCDCVCFNIERTAEAIELSKSAPVLWTRMPPHSTLNFDVGNYGSADIVINENGTYFVYAQVSGVACGCSFLRSTRLWT